MNPSLKTVSKSFHPNGANFAMGDASVRFVPRTIDYRIYNHLGTRAGGEQVQFD
jgi:prepilin-type processing-associated H-X9-DG protein